VTTPAPAVIEARLYDAGGKDRTVDVLRDPPRRVRDDQLLWIDVVGRDLVALRAIAAAFDLRPSTVDSLAEPGVRPMLRRHDRYLHVALRSAETGEGEGEGDAMVVIGVDLVAAPNVVLTVRDGPVGAFERFRAEIADATQVGRLNTATFTAALVDSILAGYLGLVEAFERRVDRLDE
jgi:Mg2+ and Co2+ transporter CorA